MKLDLIVITGGQTGVDRGALRGARDVGFRLDGYMPKDGCDERGPIPVDIAQHLKRCVIPGYSARTQVNLDIAEALIVFVLDREDPLATPGTRMTLLGARDRKLPREVVDPLVDVNGVATRLGHWMKGRGDARPLKLMVAGPRASKWASGEVETAAFMRKLGRILRGAS